MWCAITRCLHLHLTPSYQTLVGSMQLYICQAAAEVLWALLPQAAIRRRWPDRTILLAVLMVVVGCVVAGVGDLSFQMTGYIFALLSCTAQAAYLLLVEFQVSAWSAGRSCAAAGLAPRCRRDHCKTPRAGSCTLV